MTTSTHGPTEVQSIPLLQPEPRYRRAVRVNLSPFMIRKVLGLPDDVGVTQVFVQQDPVSIVVIVEGDRFEAIPEYAEAPWHSPSWAVEQVRDEQGRLWQRVVWAEDSQ